MTTRRAALFTIAAMLSGFTSVAAEACGPTVNLAAIDQRMADPALPSDVMQQAIVLKGRAVAELKDDHPASSRRLYFALMKLLGIPSNTGKYRCG